MRLKLFVFPSAIIVSIAFLIAYVIPAYREMKEKSALLLEEQKKLENINEKVNNFSALSASVSSNMSLMNGVLEYIPVSRSEDDIVNMIGNIVSGSGASIVDLQIISDSNKKTSSGKKEMSVENLKRQSLNINVKVVGSYDNTKAVLTKLSHLSRGNMVQSAIIESQTSAQQQTPNGNVLVLNVTTDFLYAPLAKIQSGQIAKVFSQRSLDFSPIANRSLEVVTPVIPEQSGKTNPFIP